KTQLEKGDSLIEGYTSKLWDFTRISVTQNDLQKLREIWVQWNDEYTALLHYRKIQVDRVYSRAVNVPTFVKKLMNIIGISEQWVTTRIKRKGEIKCIPCKNLRDLILAHPDTKKKVNVFALSICGLVIFPKALGHIDEAISNLFDRLDR
ncbi:hypothetical protein Goari_011338, partial [Gossypium aridum]|nr:hypothetical protein [Gossypium aridum]